MRAPLATLALALAVSCGALRDQTNRVLEGAGTALDAICDARDSRYLDLARDFLERGDLEAAIAELKMYIITHGYDREVSALLNLLETQLPTETEPNG